MTHTAGKLIGIVFTRVALPDLNAGLPNPMPGTNVPQNTMMPQGSSAPMTTNTNISPAMLANLQNTANLAILNASNNQQLLRQQQMMNAAGMGNPANMNQQAQQPQQQQQQQQPQAQQNQQQTQQQQQQPQQQQNQSQQNMNGIKIKMTV